MIRRTACSPTKAAARTKRGGPRDRCRSGRSGSSSPEPSGRTRVGPRGGGAPGGGARTGGGRRYEIGAEHRYKAAPRRPRPGRPARRTAPSPPRTSNSPSPNAGTPQQDTIGERHDGREVTVSGTTRFSFPIGCQGRQWIPHPTPVRSALRTEFGRRQCRDFTVPATARRDAAPGNRHRAAKRQSSGVLAGSGVPAGIGTRARAPHRSTAPRPPVRPPSGGRSVPIAVHRAAGEERVPSTDFPDDRTFGRAAAIRRPDGDRAIADGHRNCGRTPKSGASHRTDIRRRNGRPKRSRPWKAGPKAESRRAGWRSRVAAAAPGVSRWR